MLSKLVPWHYLAILLAIGVVLGGIWAAIARYDVAQQKIGYDRAASEYQTKKARADAAALVIERTMQKTLQDAQNAATEREKKLRADYAAAHAAALGLRRTVADLREQLATASADSVRATADAALAVFGECAEEYRALAGAAAGHASDVKTLTDAWPR